MQSRRSLRLMAGAFVLALPLLGSCGFDKATNTPYIPAEGTFSREGDVAILSAVVAAAQPGSGTFIATLSNSVDETTDAAAFEDLAGAGEWSDLQIGDFEPIEIARSDFVNLADEGGVPIYGEFGVGEFMELTLSFASGQTTTMQVPVIFACEEYAGLDVTAGEELGIEDPVTEESDATVDEIDEPEILEGTAAIEEPYECDVISDGEE